MITKVVVQPETRSVKVMLAGIQGPPGASLAGGDAFIGATTGNLYLKLSSQYHRVSLVDVDGVVTLTVNQTGTSSPT